jgi:hypothetical protein
VLEVEPIESCIEDEMHAIDACYSDDIHCKAPCHTAAIRLVESMAWSIRSPAAARKPWAPQEELVLDEGVATRVAFGEQDAVDPPICFSDTNLRVLLSVASHASAIRRRKGKKISIAWGETVRITWEERYGISRQTKR